MALELKNILRLDPASRQIAIALTIKELQT
jgi:hypothetical protein